MKVLLHGKEVTNPAVKFLIAALGILLALGITAAVLFLVLPLVGLVVSLSLGTVLVVVAVVLLGIPLILIGGPFIALLLTPFVILWRIMKGIWRSIWH